MRHNSAAAGGWSRFDTKTAPRRAMSEGRDEAMPGPGKARAAAAGASAP
jgi:hypothetical protein